MNWLSRIFSLLALLLLAAAGWSYFSPADKPTLTFAATELDIGEVPAKTKHDVVFTIRNSGSKARRVLNLAPA
jgi:uncharacterized protein (DUF58 family)